MSLLLQGDARHIPLADGSIQCCLTSPPYWGLRDYGLAPSVWDGKAGCEHAWGEEQVAGGGFQKQGATSQRQGRANVDEQIHRGVSQGCWCQRCGAWRGCLGLEPSIDLYVAHMVEVFREVHRVLRVDGTLWLNLGDSYISGGRGEQSRISEGQKQATNRGSSGFRSWRTPQPSELKPKDLCMIPARVALALQDDGWYLRSDVIWSKPNPIPESVRDRPTKSHEYLFLLAKNERYFYDADAIREPFTTAQSENYPARARVTGRGEQPYNGSGARSDDRDKSGGFPPSSGGRNKRSVWTIATEPYSSSHFATFPSALVEPCIRAGCPEGGMVLDPFGGSGTVAAVAFALGRRFIHLDLKYHEVARERIPPMAFISWDNGSES